jgi:methylmalonyl-CoA mutase
MDKKERLFDKFPPVTTEEWMDKINVDLKGADFRKKLVWKTREGIEVMPFYRQENLDRLPHKSSLPGDFPFVRGERISDNTWLIRQDITVRDYSGTNKRALDILMKGVTSLGFIIEDPGSISVENITILLKGIDPECVELNFLTAGMAKELVSALESVFWTMETDLKKVRVNISADPLGRLLTNGKLCVPVDEGLDYLADLVSESGVIPGMKCVEPSGTLFCNAGAGPVAELAYLLSLGNEYMAVMTSRGIKPEIAARAIRFTFGTGSDFFPEIAKLRAARLLWAVIVNKYGPKTEGASLMHIHSVTGRWNKTLYDPYVNMLRTQTEAMSAVLGGAESVTVEPFDIIFRNPDEFSERIARNQQLLLMEESHLDKVADPGAGSYYLEELTSLITREAWEIFLEIEKEGGFLAALQKGLIQDKITSAAAKRKGEVDGRQEILLGTNQYPDFREDNAPEHEINRLFPEAELSAGDEVSRIIASRGSEEFEKLRMATDNAAHRPVVFMLTIGDITMRRARAQFSSNFFACAGYRVIDNNGFDTVSDGVSAAVETGADIIVVCSSDEEYVDVAAPAYKITAGRAIVVVAGNPPCMADLKKAGVEHFISIRSNVRETLQMFNRILGIN